MFQTFVEYFLEYGVLGLFTLSFIESFFFPIPPDVVLIPLAIMNPANAIFYALVTTVASVLGGIFGYFLGLKAGRPVLERYVSKQRIKQVDTMFQKYGGWAVAIAGFTPIPYKVFTIASGISRINLVTFTTASLIGRGARFLSLGIIIQLFGQEAKLFFDKYLEVFTVLVTLIIIAIVYILKMRSEGKFSK